MGIFHASVKPGLRQVIQQAAGKALKMLKVAAPPLVQEALETVESEEYDQGLSELPLETIGVPEMGREARMRGHLVRPYTEAGSKAMLIASDSQSPFPCQADPKVPKRSWAFGVELLAECGWEGKAFSLRV